MKRINNWLMHQKQSLQQKKQNMWCQRKAWGEREKKKDPEKRCQKLYHGKNITKNVQYKRIYLRTPNAAYHSLFQIVNVKEYIHLTKMLLKIVHMQLSTHLYIIFSGFLNMKPLFITECSLTCTMNVLTNSVHQAGNLLVPGFLNLLSMVAVVSMD